MALTHDEIGRRIKRVREELGIAIEALAQACGVVPSTIASLRPARWTLCQAINSDRIAQS